MRWILGLFLLLFSVPAFAGDLPAGYTYRVLNNTPGTWQTFTFTFTPTQTGTQYIMFAFRQDPAYWRMDNVSVTAPGNSTNLITNGNMTTGGSLSVNTSNYGQMYINAPTAWGVSYQAGVYPSAAGMWTGGMWYDGAVGSYDGIYQGLNLTAGVTYTVSFQVNGDHTATTTTTGWQLAVYTGSCSQVTLDPTQCQMPTTSGFQTVAAPGQTYTTGCGNSCPAPPAPAPTYPAATISSAQQTAINQTITSHNLIYIDQYAGDHTYVKATQTGDHNIMKATIVGSYQNMTTAQTGNYNYEESVVSGSHNTITNSQDGSKALFQTVTGNYNTITTVQTGGNHFLELNIPTDNNTVSVTQSGTAQKLFSLTINSPNVGVTVQQTNATTTDSAAMSITCTTGPCTGYSYTRN